MQLLKARSNGITSKAAPKGAAFFIDKCVGEEYARSIDLEGGVPMKKSVKIVLILLLLILLGVVGFFAVAFDISISDQPDFVEKFS